VVQVPGTVDDETRERIEASAQLELRSVIYAAAASTTFVGEDGEETPYPAPDTALPATPSVAPTDGSDPNWVSDFLWARYLAFDGAAPDVDPASVPAGEAIIACDEAGFKYILGPVELTGDSIDDAFATLQQTNGQWAVQLDFDD